MRLMQWRERLQFDEVVEHRLAHLHGSVVVDPAVDHAMTEGGHSPSFEQRPSRRDDLAGSGVVIESLFAKVPLFDDTPIIAGDPEARRDPDALQLPAEKTALVLVLRGLVEREL